MKKINYSTILLFLFLSINLSANDYFWVGGSGNWSDISHWATTSGGSTFHIQVPTADDNVIFDANSFTGPNQRITINSQEIFCDNFDWRTVTMNPTFTGSTTDLNLHIHGSVFLHVNMIFDYAGNVHINPKNGKNIDLDLAGQKIQQDIYFEGPGTTSLRSDVTIEGNIIIQNGDVKFGSSKVSTKYFDIQPQAPTTVNLQDVELTIHGKDFLLNGSWTYAMTAKTHDLTLHKGNSKIILEANQASIHIIVTGFSMPFYSFHEVVFSDPNGDGSFSSFDDIGFNVQTVNFEGNGIVNAKSDIKKFK